jgi:hypothetical protein
MCRISNPGYFSRDAGCTLPVAVNPLFGDHAAHKAPKDAKPLVGGQPEAEPAIVCSGMQKQPP